MLCDESLQVEFTDEVASNFFAWDQNLVADKNCVILPQLLEKNSVEDIDYFVPSNLSRASSDLAAAYLLFHDSTLHAAKKFDPEEQKFFDEFEKIRVISEIKNCYFGAAKNILAKIESDIYSGSTGLSLILLQEIFAQEIGPRSKEFAVENSQALSKKILQEIKNLAQKTANQSDFALGVERVLEMLKNEQEPEKSKEEQEQSQKKSEAENEKSKNDLSSLGQENIDSQENDFDASAQESSPKKIEQEQKIFDVKEGEKKAGTAVNLDGQGFDEKKIEFKNLTKFTQTSSTKWFFHKN